jgi:cytochrome P450
MTTFLQPSLDVDLFTDRALTDPYPIYRQLRQTAAAVYLPGHDLWALPRYEQVKAALSDWQAFSSEDGVCVEPAFNEFYRGTVLQSDPPLHDRLRNVLAPRMTPRALSDVKGGIEQRASDLVSSLVDRGSFDAITDLAAIFPVSVVADLVGLPGEERDQLLERADASFNLFGPDNPRAQASLGAFPDTFAYVNTYATRERLAPGSFGAAIYAAADAGQIEPEQCIPLLLAYLFAGMDTTVNAIGHLIWLLGRHPDQWQILREDPSRVSAALEEGLRLETPVQAFVRGVRKDFTADGVTVPAGSRVLLLYGSANRDERRWENPTVFDVRRNPVGHLAFGYGTHNCAGQGLARLEAAALIGAFVRQVESISLGEPARRLNNALRGLASLPVTVTPASGRSHRLAPTGANS